MRTVPVPRSHPACVYPCLLARPCHARPARGPQIQGPSERISTKPTSQPRPASSSPSPHPCRMHPGPLLPFVYFWSLPLAAPIPCLIRNLEAGDNTCVLKYELVPSYEAGLQVEQQTPQGVLVCDHAGRVINKLSLWSRFLLHSSAPGGDLRCCLGGDVRNRERCFVHVDFPRWSADRRYHCGCSSRYCPPGHPPPWR